MSFEKDIFKEKFRMTESEMAFIEEADAAPGTVGHENFSMADKYKVLSIMYLAKQIEASSLASDKHSKALNLLTFVIAIAAVIEIVLKFTF